MPHTTDSPRPRRLTIAVTTLMLFVSMTSAGYEVRPGETLAGIAADHGTTVAALVEENDITNPDLIVAGQILTIPGESGETNHTVGPGETLAGIAASYGLTISDLIDANDLSNPDLLRIGQLISIPGGQESSTGQGQIIAKEGADGLLGMAIEHPEFPEGLGVVIKIAHGWNPRATWYIARGILGTLGFALRNPYQLFKQKAFLVPGVVPEDRLPLLEQIPTWDDWDPDRDRWMFEWDRYAPDRGI